MVIIFHSRVILRGEAQTKAGKKDQTQGHLRKKITDMQRQIKQTTQEASRYLHVPVLYIMYMPVVEIDTKLVAADCEYTCNLNIYLTANKATVHVHVDQKVTLLSILFALAHAE